MKTLANALGAKMGRTAEQMMADFPLRIVGENPAAPGEVLATTEVPAWFERGRAVDPTPEALEAESGDVPFVLEGADFTGEWRVARVPVSEIDAADTSPDESTPARLDAIRAAPELFRPIYEVDSTGRVKIIDGWHRLRVAKERGETEIEALVVRRNANDPNILNQRAPSSRFEVRREKASDRYCMACARGENEGAAS